jgi:hypothetical protein
MKITKTIFNSNQHFFVRELIKAFSSCQISLIRFEYSSNSAAAKYPSLNPLLSLPCEITYSPTFLLSQPHLHPRDKRYSLKFLYFTG